MIPRSGSVVAFAVFATSALSDPLPSEPFQLTATQMDTVTSGGTFTVIITRTDMSTGRPTSMARQLAEEDATQTMLRARREFILDLCGAECDIESPW